ncbi:M28 family peptidase [Pontibacter silvestris]|uniref:M28 family peptidase n=1 Tax=Pontibacter silvestris TaxID=2305183 RepID=A0ABW4X372_9BACT|nr:M28 family peptidase [Pontibacter silvestris]MCC9135003.1 M28 family peptidase [Pontibacter silvestris]
MKISFSFLLMLLLPLLSLAQKPVLDKQQILKDIKILSADSMGGRLSGSTGNKMSQDYIVQRFKQIGLKPYNGDYKQHFRLESKKVVVDQATNLIGYIAGKTTKAIVITAHYDHVGERDGETYNGADDNASGVGALLAAASYFKRHKPVHTLIFVALDGEELGLRGADAFLENPPVPLKNMLLNVNMDMLSINDKGELYASGAYHYPQLKPYLEQVAPRAEAKLVLGHDLPEQGHDDWTSQSDHYQFHKRDIPFVYFGVEDHPHYHKPTDEFVQVNQAFYPDAASLVIDFLKLVDVKQDSL